MDNNINDHHWRYRRTKTATLRWRTVSTISVSKQLLWHMRLDACLPPLGSRVRISVTPCEFHGGRNGVWVVFFRFPPFSPVTNFISLFLHTHLVNFVSFHFISSTPVMVCQAWSAGILAINRPSIQGLHRSSSLDPTLSWARNKLLEHINTPFVQLMLSD